LSGDYVRPRQEQRPRPNRLLYIPIAGLNYKPLINNEIVPTGNAEDQPFVVSKLGHQ
jgi:hypothetical protein